MTATGGRPTREQVEHPRGKPVAGLFVRHTRDGRTVFEMRTARHGRHTLKATTATDAVREQRAELAKLDASPLLGRSDTTLDELCTEWEQWALAPGSNYSARTVELYSDLLDRHVLPVLGQETRASAVRVEHVRLLIDKLNAKKLSGSSVHGILTATSALLRFAARRGVIEANPVRLLERGDKPSAKRNVEPRYLDRQQIDALLSKMGDEFRPVCAVLAFAGLRVSEALALRWRDVDLDGAMLDVHGTKTKASTQPVPMTGDLVAELKAHRSRYPGVGDALVFPTATGAPQWRRNVLRALYVAGDAAKLNPPGVKRVSCHDLRHSCAGLLLAAGVPAPRAAAISGTPTRGRFSPSMPGWSKASVPTCAATWSWRCAGPQSG